MPCELLQLEGRVVLDDGRIAYTKDGAIDFIRDGGDLSTIHLLMSEDVTRYEFISGKRLSTVTIDDEFSVMPSDMTTWNIPAGYENFNVLEFCQSELVKRALNTNTYRTRLDDEYTAVVRNGMDPLFKVIRALVDDFRQRRVVWGVGRGSSCASLILFLIGLHRVDPVLYDIDMKEFFKEDPK